MDNKLISVIMPVKNGSNYIKEAIEGIKKQNMNVEIIVVDDGSTDDTSHMAKELDCKVIRHEASKGQVIGKNTGLKSACGKYIMFHDHDDVMNEGALLKMYSELNNCKDIYATMAKVQDFLSPDISEEEKQKTSIRPEPYYGLFTGAVLIKKEAIDKIGLFSENIHTGEIIEWQNKMKENNLEIKKLDFVATNRRVHTSNFGKTNQKKEFMDYASVLRAKLGKK